MILGYIILGWIGGAVTAALYMTLAKATLVVGLVMFAVAGSMTMALLAVARAMSVDPEPPAMGSAPSPWAAACRRKPFRREKMGSR